MGFQHDCFSGGQQGGVKWTFNAAKGRWEWWAKEAAGDEEWVLHHALPARCWKDNFAVNPEFHMGLQTEIAWAVNGRANGANDPGASCFAAANEVGGGLNMSPLAGGQAGDYTAIHWGGNYPTLLHHSPHVHCAVGLQQVTDVAVLTGLVDNTRATEQEFFGLPDNGVFLYYDTNVDNSVHYVIQSGGISVTNVTGPSPSPATPIAGNYQVSDDGESVRFIFSGSVVVDWVDVSGAAYAALRAAQLQPYMAIVSRAALQLRELHVYDFRMVMDRGM